MRKEFDLDSTEGRVDFLKKAAAVLRDLSPVEADIYIKKLAEETKISEGAIRLETNGNNSEKRASGYRTHRTQTDKPQEAITTLEKNIIKLILQSSSYYPKIVPYEQSAFTTICGQNIYKEIKELYEENEELDVRKLADALEPSDEQALQGIMENVRLAHKEEQIFEDCIRAIKRKELVHREQELIMQLSIADEENNTELVTALTQELMNIQMMIKNGRG